MITVRRRLIGLCLPPLAFAALDGALTLVGQPAAYWSGEATRVDEMSPTFHQLLAISPLAFVAGLLLWMALFVGLILLVSDTLALAVSIAVTFAHAVGAATWLLWRFQYGYQACNALFLAAAVALALGIRWGWRAGPADEYRLPLAARWRYTLAATLFAVAVYLFLWPR